MADTTPQTTAAAQASIDANEKGIGTAALAAAAIAEVQSDMLVGLGSGRTSKRAIRALADRVHNESLKIQCVATSERSDALAKELGLDVIDFHRVSRVHHFFDGADEVDREFRVLRGSTGSMARGRMVAGASDCTLYLVDAEKVVDKVGTDVPLSIAVMAYGFTSIRDRIRDMGYNGVVRRNAEGETFITDNGNLILDVTLESDENLEQLSTSLNDIPGIIDHGLFIHEADEILIDHHDRIEHLIRPDED